MIPDNPDHTFTHITAVGAIVSPLWLHTLSDTAATALPILGALWLLIQAAVFIYKNTITKPFWKKS